MTVESNYVTAIAMISDWLKRLAPVFQPMRRKTKPIAPCRRDFSRSLSELQELRLVHRAVCSRCDWSE